MLASRKALILLCLLAWFAQGCGTKLGKTFSGLAGLQAEIVKKFGEEGVHVQENNFDASTFLVVTFINSSLNDKTEGLRAQRAKETAEIVKTDTPRFQISIRSGLTSSANARPSLCFTSPKAWQATVSIEMLRHSELRRAGLRSKH